MSGSPQAGAASQSTGAGAGLSRSKRRKVGRRRRGQRDVVLDFSKQARRKHPCGAVHKNDDSKPAPDAAEAADSGAEAGRPAEQQVAASRKRNRKGKLLLSTSSKDYQGNLGLPGTVAQREFESTGQFFRRLDRLVAKAKVEANLESRFDINLMQKPGMKRHSTSETVVDLASSSRYSDKRRKRYGR